MLVFRVENRRGQSSIARQVPCRFSIREVSARNAVVKRMDIVVEHFNLLSEIQIGFERVLTDT